MDMTSIKIAIVLASIVGSRDVAHNLKAVIEKAKSRHVELDFTDVEFLSRSAAHELLALKDNVAHSFFWKKIVSFVNTSDNVARMFRVVAASRAVPKPREEYSIERADVNFLYKLPSEAN